MNDIENNEEYSDIRHFTSYIFSDLQLDQLIKIVLRYDAGSELIEELERIALFLARSAEKKGVPSTTAQLRKSIKKITAFKKALSALSDFELLLLVGMDKDDRDEYIEGASKTFEEIRPLFNNARKELINDLKPIFDIHGQYAIPATASADSDCMKIVAIVIDAAQEYAPEKNINFDPEAIVRDLFETGIPRPLKKKAIIEEMKNEWKSQCIKE